uniref:Unconventional myosin-XVIIIa n=1 Tax=Timema tahoe TaxID=61484 RepID=A0A7R9FGE7_9NEOP|nr:unnamed protein product [Timema tahoe]
MSPDPLQPKTSSINTRSLLSPSSIFSSTSQVTMSPDPPHPKTPSINTRSFLSPSIILSSPSRVTMSPPPRDILSPLRLQSSSKAPSITSNCSFLSRSPSPNYFSPSSGSFSTSCSVFSPEKSIARRVFPQASTRLRMDDLKEKEQAPVVFNAGLSFVLGIRSQKVRQQFKPKASHTQPKTASSTLTSKIKCFLKRTDHIMDEWVRVGRKKSKVHALTTLPFDCERCEGQSRSNTNIAIKSLQLFSQADNVRRSRSLSRVSNDTLDEADELTEMTADLAEEHSTSMLATERLESETSERFRMEKELQDLQLHNKTLQQTTDRVEMELLYVRAADLNGIGSDEDEDGEGDAALYKQRYERAVHELEFTRRRLQQQHEDDLEQLVGLKKQLEKKLADAFEEVEEQRQVVGQWKRKVHKLNADNNDLRLLLEEQNARNVLLEKKQRKFDSDSQHLQDELRQEKQMRDRLSREKELALAEKYSVEQSLSSLEIELDLKEEKVNTLSQQLEELTFGGKTEAEVAQLKKAKHELEKKVKEQEEELDDLAGQVQLLEQAKLRLEMSLEQQRKENRREMAQRDEELEDVHCNAQKKVKVLEAQLETEHEERTHLLREKHELERRLATMDEEGRAKEALQEEQLLRLRRDLRRNKVLLRDAQTMLERSRGDSPSKAILRQLRNQLEDTDFARTIAVKAKQALEMDLADLQTTLDEVQRAKSEAEEAASLATRERSEIRSQLEENEEELSEVLKKYRAAVQQLSVDQMVLQDQAGMVAELESERSALKEQLAELAIKLESMETVGDPISSLAQKRLEFRIKELESKLELEQTTRCRMEVQISRMKEAVDKLQNECAIQRTKEQTSQDTARKLQRTVRELRDGMSVAEAREAEITQKKRDLEKRLETAEAEATAAKGDLRLALKRIEDLQSAIQGDMEEGSDSEPDNSDSDHESDYSDESLSTFLTNKGRSPPSSLHLNVTAKATERAKHNNASEVLNASANCIPKESFA